MSNDQHRHNLLVTTRAWHNYEAQVEHATGYPDKRGNATRADTLFDNWLQREEQ